MSRKSHNKDSFFQDPILWLVFSLFLFITLYGLLSHAPWRDEAQSWLLVRDLGIGGLIAQMPFEGSPPLWHLIIMPFAKLGLPYFSEMLIHYVFALAGIFIFLFFSPLPKSVKILTPFTYYFIFEYAIVARNYNLTALILFIIAAVYKQRLERPILYSCLLFLLSWTNVHSLIISLALGGLFIYDILKGQKLLAARLTAVGIALIGPLSAVLMMLPRTDQYSYQMFNGWQKIFRALAAALLPSMEVRYTPTYFLIAASLLWLPLVGLLKRPRAKIIFFSSAAWLIYIFAFKHGGDLRHIGLLILFLLFAWWINYQERDKQGSDAGQIKQKLPVYILSACFVISAVYGEYAYIGNQVKMFSGSKEMAKYLSANNLTQELIAAYPSYAGSAILPYLPGTKFYQMDTGRLGTYLTWDKTFSLGKELPYVYLKRALLDYYAVNAPQATSALLILNQAGDADPDLSYITQTSQPTFKDDEYFYLYRLRLK